MKLFRPYERSEPADAEHDATTADSPDGKKRRRSMVIGASSTRPTPSAPAAAPPASTTRSETETNLEPTNEPTNAELAAQRQGPRAKAGPTPSRKQAEAARRERVNPTLSPKEAKRREAAANRETRVKAMAERDNTPEKALLRDYVDARRSLAEFMLPSILVLLAISFLSSVYPMITWVTTVVMYLFIVAVAVDMFIMWRGFKKLLATRIPRADTRGLVFYGMNRVIQIRRFRLPAPRVKRGDQI